MSQFNSDNSAAFINYVSHTNSSVAQCISFTSAKSDNESAIIRNQTTYTEARKTHCSVVEPEQLVY